MAGLAFNATVTAAPYIEAAAVSVLTLAVGLSPASSAITAVATYVISNTAQVAAGPMTYWSCVAGCELIAGGNPAFLGPCIAACLPVFFLPSP